MKNDYLVTQKPLKALLIFALPMIIGNLFQQTYTMADSVIVGRFVGEKALAAVGASYSLTSIFICVAIGGGIGASVIVSRYFGAKKYGKMKRAVYTAFLSFLVCSILLALFGLAAGKWILELLHTPGDVMGMAGKYLNIYFLGLPFLFMYNVLSSMFNALGKSKIPLGFLIFSSLFNIALDYLLVTRYDMGVAGVAWATLIAQGISAVLSFLVFTRVLRRIDGAAEASGDSTDRAGAVEASGTGVSGGTADGGDNAAAGAGRFFSRAEFFSMLRIALPSILQQSTVSIGMMLVQSVVNSFGSEALAGYSAGMRIESLCVVPMSAIGNAVSSYTAQNIGAGKQERVIEGYHVANRMVIFFAVMICFVLELLHGPIITLFLGADKTVIAMLTGESYLTFMGWFFCLIGFKMSVDGLLRGSGDMRYFTIANLVNLSIRVIFSMALAPKYGISMVWYTVPVGWFVNWAISYARYRTGSWKRLA